MSGLLASPPPPFENHIIGAVLVSAAFYCFVAEIKNDCKKTQMIQLDVSHSFDKPICIIFYY